jgi:hypothetical protein
MLVALTAQVTSDLAAGTYCVQLSDPGALAASVNFAVRISQFQTPPTPTGATVTDTFAIKSNTLGGASHAFADSAPGSVAVTLSSISPTTTVGLGLGIPGAGSTDCSFTKAIVATPGSQIMSPVDAGQYCVKIYSLGAPSGPVSFTVNIIHPS